MPVAARRRKRTQRTVIVIFFFIAAAIAGIFGVQFLLQHIFKQKPYVSPLPISASIFIQSSVTSDPFRNSLADDLRQASIPFADIRVYTDGSVTILLDKNRSVLMTKAKSLREQVSSLQLIYSRLTIEGKDFSRLDLRFDNPVISY